MSLPLFVAGPIIRRLDADAVAVWVALSRQATVRLDVYSGPQDVGMTAGTLAAPVSAPEATATATALKVGPGLAVAVVRAQIVNGPPFIPGTLHSYNVTVDGNADLRSEGLLRNDATTSSKALGYQEGTLPTFVATPARIEDLVIVHASCHKLHGDGPTMLSQLDKLIGDARMDPALQKTRPHQLFLTGDQIYADEVATALLPGLASLGTELVGAEQLPGPPAAPGSFTAGVSAFPAGRRQKLVALAGFTSSSAANHLLSLGEFCAMYSVAWNHLVWPSLAKAQVPPGAGEGLPARLAEDASRSAPDAPEVLADVASPGLETALTDLFGASDESKEALEGAREFFLASKKALEKLPAELAKVRRALANVPTYMIFDDHEVTDDWFLTKAWRERVLGRDLGRTILRNGLVAYTLFQAWGNDPLGWNTPLRRDLLGFIAARDWVEVDKLLGLAPVATPQIDFSYTVPGPAHTVSVLDTRTRRRYRSPQGHPELLSPEALDFQLQPGPLPAGIELLVVVSPAPVLGPPLLDEVGMPIAVTAVDLAASLRGVEKRREEIERTGWATGRLTGDENWDIEGWAADPPAFERLLARLATYQRTLILSGDVHYGAAYSLGYLNRQPRRTARIVQLTSSAARNEWPYHVPELVSQHGWMRALQKLGLPKRMLGWETVLPPVLGGDPSGEALELRGRVHRVPVLLPNHGWRHEHPINGAHPPDWMWELDQVLDRRGAAKRPEPARPDPISEPDLPAFPAVGGVVDLMNPGGGALGYSRLAQVHQRAVDKPIARGLVFLNNVGRVTFRREGADLALDHALFSMRLHPESLEEPQAYTVHSTALAQPVLAFPDRVGAH